MKYFLVSDNIDTLAGMRMVGVNGVVVHSEAEVRDAIERAAADADIGLVLVTSKLFQAYSPMIFHYKLHRRRPLIVEMPDRHSSDNVADNIRHYIEQAVGIKI
ncbi:MAG: V-type ATP synthase subunit F [Oscillospiraceae bacterium]